MKRSILLLMILLAITSCKGQRVQNGAYNLMLKGLLSHSVDEIGVDSLVKVQDEVMLLDARAPDEYEVSHIAGARLVGYKNFDSTRVAGIDRDQPIVVYCSVGYRSEKIAKKLEDDGFTHVSNLYGGIFEWRNEGHPVVNASGPTDKVHAYSKIWSIWLTKGEKVYAAK